ncbi:hypothetical protein GOC68_25790 [Sinorhizobium medicae]|nr:hypothetical protein [Sinorhizobium medicae]
MITHGYTETMATSKSHRLDLTRPNWIEVDLNALDHNYRLLKTLVAPGIRIHPSVKSAAYGLGVAEIARRFVELGAETIACGSLTDAEAIREAGDTNIDLMVFGGTLPSGIPRFLDLNVMPTVHNSEIAEAVSSLAKTPQRVYVKVDAGWGRLGFPLKTAEGAIVRIASMPNIVIEGIYTHLPFTDLAGATWAQERTILFNALIDRLKKRGIEAPVTQARSSSGVLLGIKDECTTVCPGSILYGKPSLAEGVIEDLGFEPVLSSIRSRLVHISPNASDKSSAGFSRFAERVAGATGVIPFGRKDGNRTPRPGLTSYAILKGIKVPILSISSELCVLDLSSVPNPRVGDEVLLLGRAGTEEITLAELASNQDAGMNDVLLMMRDRMPVIFRQNPATE